MKVVILAGGFGTRISEESAYKPKPMIEIGGMPILWHIMKIYSCYGFNEFVICAGYKQHIIKEWFADYFLHTSDITFDFTRGNEIIVHNKHVEEWKVTVVDTGLYTQTGGASNASGTTLMMNPSCSHTGMGVAMLISKNCSGIIKPPVKSAQFPYIISGRKKVFWKLEKMDQ